MMTFSAKIKPSHYLKDDGLCRLYLEAIIDRKRAPVPTGIYIKPEDFDQRKQMVRTSHPNANTFNKELQKMLATANEIASRYRLEEKRLTPALLVDEFINPSNELDLIRFIEQELELRKPQLAYNTIKQHTTVINKLKGFSKRIRFGDLNSDLMSHFKNHMMKANGDEKGNSQSTANKILKIVKQYCIIARQKGHKFEDPFKLIKIKTFKSNRQALTWEELQKIEHYYQSSNTPDNHKAVLRYFLFSCFTGLRISDIKVITWKQIHDNVLIYQPIKTRYTNNTVMVPLLGRDKEYLPPFKAGSDPIFTTYADQVTNRILKDIAEATGINKTLTYHTSRHTFGSLLAEGGDIVAVQKMMGHEDIKTTLGYVHTSLQALVDAKQHRYSKLKASKNLGAKGLTSKKGQNQTL